jgi:hypothetical protein
LIRTINPHLRKRLASVAIFKKVRRGEWTAPALTDGGMPEVYQAVRLGIRKRIKDDRFEDAKNGCVRPDAQGERQYCHGAEAGILPELTKGETEVVHGMNEYLITVSSGECVCGTQ